MVNILKFRSLFFFCIQIKFWLSRLNFTKLLVRKANREGPDQTDSTASSFRSRFNAYIMFIIVFSIMVRSCNECLLSDNTLPG